MFRILITQCVMNLRGEAISNSISIVQFGTLQGAEDAIAKVEHDRDINDGVVLKTFCTRLYA